MVCLQLNWNWITEAHRCLPNGAARQQTLKAVFQIIANYAFLVWKSRGGLKLWLYSGRNAKRLLSVEFANEHWWQFRMKLCSSFWVSDLLIPFSNMKPLSILKKSFFSWLICNNWTVYIHFSSLRVTVCGAIFIWWAVWCGLSTVFVEVKLMFARI